MPLEWSSTVGIPICCRVQGGYPRHLRFSAGVLQRDDVEVGSGSSSTFSNACSPARSLETSSSGELKSFIATLK